MARCAISVSFPSTHSEETRYEETVSREGLFQSYVTQRYSNDRLTDESSTQPQKLQLFPPRLVLSCIYHKL